MVTGMHITESAIGVMPPCYSMVKQGQFVLSPPLSVGHGPPVSITCRLLITQFFFKWIWLSIWKTHSKLFKNKVLKLMSCYKDEWFWAGSLPSSRRSRSACFHNLSAFDRRFRSFSSSGFSYGKWQRFRKLSNIDNIWITLIIISYNIVKKKFCLWSFADSFRRSLSACFRNLSAFDRRSRSFSSSGFNYGRKKAEF